MIRTNDLHGYHEMGCSSPAVKENHIMSQYYYLFILENETLLGKKKGQQN